MKLTRGWITDRPWGQTLGALARRGFTGQLSLNATDGKRLAIAFDRGMAIGAVSPLPTDVIVRIALTNHLVAASQVPALARRVTAQPERDEIEVVVEAGRLTPEQEIVLRERAILQRAARTFSIDAGSFSLEDEITIPTSPCSVDVFAIVYLGTRRNLSEQRLVSDLRWLGNHFRVEPHAGDELLRYGFASEDRAIVEALRDGTSVSELEVEHRELDPRAVQAVLLAVAACGTAIVSTLPAHDGTPCEPSRQLAAGSSPGASVQRIHTPEPLVVKVPLDQVPLPRTASPQHLARLVAPPPDPVVSQRALSVARTVTPPRPRPPRVKTAEPIDLELDFASESSSNPDAVEDPAAAAAAAFRRGEAAIGSEQLDQAVVELARAVELQPEHQDYVAMLAWARFCAAPDKAAVADVTRKTIAQTIAKTDKPVLGEFLLGRVERMMGRDRDALAHFEKVLALRPRHPGAAAEIRVIELRMATATRPSLFGRKL